MARTTICFGLCALFVALAGCETKPGTVVEDGSTNPADQETGAPLLGADNGEPSDPQAPEDPAPQDPDPQTPDNISDNPADLPDEEPTNTDQPPADPNEREPAVWNPAFDASATGALSAVWGSAPDDVWVVGGKPDQGEIYHFDGQAWQAMDVPDVPLLVWVYGFEPDDVYAVGLGGGAVHYDGQSWTAMSTGTTEDLWGVWGSAPDDIWVVGGNVGQGEPTILHYNGASFSAVTAPANDRDATSLFKVWGIGSKVFAVGERGLIIQFEEGRWFQVPAGANADEDFVALWGTSEDHIVAVGGRSSARLSVYDGTSWTTTRPNGIPGLNAIYMVEPDEAVVGGVSGYVGSYNPLTDTLTTHEADTNLAVHGAWGDRGGRYYAVGGRFATPFSGVALLRTFGDPGISPAPPLDAAPECMASSDCPTGRTCQSGACAFAPGCSGEDDDSDGWLNSCDNCKNHANADQADADGDGQGDACDACPGFDDAADVDGDGVPDGCDICIGSDDTLDTDADGVPDGCDLCPGGNDAADADTDGVPDGCDKCPGFDDSVDADNDGVPDNCDACAGFDDNNDADGDSVPDACDICPDFDDSEDDDGDGIPNGCDACNGNIADDVDADGVPDACDICDGFDDNADADTDGIPDGCDACPGADDKDDADTDGVPDGCDICSGGDDSLDSDGDTVPNFCDACPGFDDNADADADGVPDDCDICSGANDTEDADADGVPDGCDICAGFDDNVDSDGNGIPDGCCAAEPDCLLGETCTAGFCEAVAVDIELGTGNPYAKIVQGGQMPMVQGFQGFGELRLGYQTLGFTANGSATISLSVIMVDDGTVVLNVPPAAGNPFVEIAPGINQQLNDFWFIFLNPATLFGREANLVLTITDETNPAISVTIQQTVVIVDANG